MLSYSSNLSLNIMGTPDYIPPEVIKHESIDNYTID